MLRKNSVVSFSKRTWLEPKGWEAPGVGSELELKLERQTEDNSMGLSSLMEGSSRSFIRAGTGSDLSFRKTSLETWTLQHGERDGE